MSWILPVLLFGVALGVVASVRDVNFGTAMWNPTKDICEPEPRGRGEWIVHVREPDYGWRQHTHRANIALAMYGYQGAPDEMRKMGLQLEVEITRALFRNSEISDSDLALYIHALLATNKNPRNFHGTNLVADLLQRVNSAVGGVHPFLVLALCNSHAVTFDHLLKTKRFLELAHTDEDHPDVDSRDAQLKAIAIKAFACAADLDRSLAKFPEQIEQAMNCLRKKYNETDGSFGNVYTTSLAVQAFMASKKRYDIDLRKSLKYLETEAYIDINLIKAYYIEMALNAENVTFIRQLYHGPMSGPGPDPAVKKRYVQYTIKKGFRPDVYFTVTLNVPEHMNFYEIMKMTAGMSNRFTFSSYENLEGLPMVYALSGTPNDAEQNLFWTICRQNDVDHDRHIANTTTFSESPASLMPNPDEHIIYWYLNTECPQ